MIAERFVDRCYVGGIVGVSKGACEISKCSNTGAVKSERATWQSGVGGIAGVIEEGGEISICYNEGEVRTEGIGTAAGGIAGIIIGSAVSWCYSIGEIGTGASNLGGIVGAERTSGDGNKIVECYYLEGSAAKGVGKDNGAEKKNVEAISDEDMKTQEFVDLLNSTLVDEGKTESFELREGRKYPQIVGLA